MVSKAKINKTKAKIPIAALAMSAVVFMGSANADTAQTEEDTEYQLDQVLVTALKYETRDVQTPASTKIYTNNQLAATGASNVLEALKQMDGLIYSSYWPGRSAYEYQYQQNNDTRRIFRHIGAG